MYDILTLEPDDDVVMRAIKAVIAGRATIGGPEGDYRLLTPGDTWVEGDGGTGVEVLVIVGHGNANKLSGCGKWTLFREHFDGRVDWNHKTEVYLAACSTAGEGGSAFVHGHFAGGVRAAFPTRVRVWASTTAVRGRDLTGDWVQL